MTAPDLVALVVETSRTVDLGDAERARDGARLLERTGTAALPVVAGRFIGEGAELMRVWRVIDIRTLPPPSDVAADRPYGPRAGHAAPGRPLPSAVGPGLTGRPR